MEPKNRKKPLRLPGWFTLAELIVVIAILAILSAVGLLALQGYSSDAEGARAKANVRSVYSAIAAESALTGNSPRHYVVHDPAAALADGAVAYVDGSPVALTGGQHGTPGTNYSAGNPDWAKLKLDPGKFRVAAVGAIDALLPSTSGGRARSASFFQVAATDPGTGVAAVTGNFPTPTAAGISSGAVVWLVKDPASTSPTGAMVDGGVTGASGATPSSSSSSGGGVSQYLGCDTPDIVVPKVGLVWAACNLGATTAYKWQPLPTCPYSEGEDCFASVRHILGDYYQWGRNTPVHGTGTVMESHAPGSQPAHNDFIISNETTWQDWLSSPDGNRWWWEGSSLVEWTYADAGNSAMRGPCPVGYHVPTAREWNLTAAALDNTDNGDPEIGTDEHWYGATSPSPGFYVTQGTAQKLLIPPVWWMLLAYPGSPLLFVDGEDLGWYWSSTPSGIDSLWVQWSESFQWGFPERRRYFGKSVRCVRNAVNMVVPECGIAANWSWTSRQPDYGLCKSGLPTEVTGTPGAWTWTCRSSLDPLVTTGHVVCNAQ